MKIARPSQEDVEAVLNLMRVLNSIDGGDGFPCLPQGGFAGDDPDWFIDDDPEHLRKFYDRVMGCLDPHPGALVRCIGGFHLAWTNGVWDPDADCYEWHPDLVPAVEARSAKVEGGEG